MNEARLHLVAALTAIVFCFTLSMYALLDAERKSRMDLRIERTAIEDWMLEALPGIGPATAAQMEEQLAAGLRLEAIRWPARSRPYVEQLFVENAVQDASSRKAMQER